MEAVITNPNQDVIFGGLELMIGGKDVAYVDGYTLRVTGEDASLGVKQPVTTTLFSMLLAGSIIASDRDDNRQPSLIIEVIADHNDGLALAKGEAALQLAADQPAELVWRPPQAGAPVAVFDIVHATLEPIYSDMDEVNQLRAYRLTMSALPYARSADEVYVEANPAADVSVLIDNADSVTGWASPTGAIVDVGSSLRFVADAYDPPFSYPLANYAVSRYTGAGLASLGSHEYFTVEWRSDNKAAGQTIRMIRTVDFGTYTAQGSAAPIREVNLDTDWVSSTFSMSGIGAFTLEIELHLQTAGVGAGNHLEIRDMRVSDTVPPIGEGFQQSQFLTCEGSVPTQGSIRVEHETTDLGDTWVYTRQNKPGETYQPSLSPYWRVLPASLTTMSGWTGSNVDTSIYLPVMPVSAVPEGDYHMVARIKVDSGSAQFTVNSRCFYDPTANVEIAHDETRTYNIPLTAGTYTMVQLGVWTLPAVRLGPEGRVVIQIDSTLTFPGNNLTIDDVWLFKDDGQLTAVRGLSRRRLKVDAPSLDEPSGALWTSDDEDFGRAYSPASLAMSRQHHDLRPGDNLIWTLTTGVAKAKVGSRHHPRWNTYPGK